MDYTVRPYRHTDETAWVRCRLLAFLETSYFDDVKQRKTSIAEPGFELVAVDPAGELVGLIDVEVEQGEATVDTIAVHPDHVARGIGRALLNETLHRLRSAGVATLDAWTRDDPGTLRWYRSNGFTESDHYLHVYADAYMDEDEPKRAVVERHPEMLPVKMFLHARLEQEASVRERFARVHICRRFARTV
ncbi:MAG TPA: GNAT family N-acetyltransferase [Candidatus Stackebrandtia excrementipullorum]|nr:GNAT family N-acetyltransferase [Candidatus Stackebrandtia excrementipullorum]